MGKEGKKSSKYKTKYYNKKNRKVSETNYQEDLKYESGSETQTQ